MELTRPVAFVLALPALLAAAEKPAPAATPMKLRVAHAYGKEHPFHKSYERFGEVLQEKSAGSMVVQIYSDGSLCPEQACVSLLRQGVLDATTVSANGIEAVAPEATFLDLLYLWKDREHWQRGLDGDVGERITEVVRRGSAKGGAPPFEILGYWGGSEVHMLGRKRGYETLEDLTGMKIRIQNSPLQFELWKALGAVPMSLDMGTIKDALKDGVVDAVPLTNTTNWKQKFYESAPHISEMGIAIVARMFLFSGQTWQKLSAEQRAVVLRAGSEATATNRSLEGAMSDSAIDSIRREPGVKIYSFKDRVQMRDRLRPVQERHADKLGLLDLLQKIDQEWEKKAPAGRK